MDNRNDLITATFATLLLGFISGLFLASQTWHEPIEFKLGEILLVAVTGLLWWSTRGLVLGADKNAARQLRAYVSLVPNFAVAFGEQSLARGKFLIENTGVVPARRVRSRGDIIVGPNPLPEDYEFPKIRMPYGIPMAAFRGNKYAGEVTASRLFTASEIEEIRTERKRVYIYGECLYDDGFGVERFTKFSAAIWASLDHLSKLTSNYLPSDLVVEFQMVTAGNEAN